MLYKDTVTTPVCDDKPSIVINLAAQAGVRYSIINPSAYLKSNIV